MRITVSNPNLNQKFRRGEHRGKNKGIVADIDLGVEYINIVVRAKQRIVGKFTFSRSIPENADEPMEATLTKSYVYDGEYSPFEFAVSELTRFLRRKKIKYINLL